MKKYSKFLFLIPIVVLVLILVIVVPSVNTEKNSLGAGLGSLGDSPFGGKILMKPAPIIQTKEIQCTSMLICGGNEEATWLSTVDASCSKGTFTLNPDLPKLKSSIASEGYCIPASAGDKTHRTPPIAIDRWILGLYSQPTPTEIGICTCVNGAGPVQTVTVTPVSVNLTHVTMFGTSKY